MLGFQAPICAMYRAHVPCTIDLLLAQAEDLLAQEENLLLVQEDDLLLVQVCK